MSRVETAPSIGHRECDLVARGPEVIGEGGHTRRSVHLVSMSPIGPCEVTGA